MIFPISNRWKQRDVPNHQPMISMGLTCTIDVCTWGDLLTWQICILGRNCRCSTIAGVHSMECRVERGCTWNYGSSCKNTKNETTDLNTWIIYPLLENSFFFFQLSISIGEIMFTNQSWGGLCSEKPISSSYISYGHLYWRCFRMPETNILHMPHKDLVGGLNPSEKCEIPNMWTNKTCSSHHQPEMVVFLK